MSAADNTNFLPLPGGLGDLESPMFHRLLPLNLDNPRAGNMPSLWKIYHSYLHQHRHHRLPENESLQSHAIRGCLTSPLIETMAFTPLYSYDSGNRRDMYFGPAIDSSDASNVRDYHYKSGANNRCHYSQDRHQLRVLGQRSAWLLHPSFEIEQIAVHTAACMSKRTQMRRDPSQLVYTVSVANVLSAAKTED
ncbi:hypothetical protein SCARD494_01830 [Seiridium cardinale]